MVDLSTLYLGKNLTPPGSSCEEGSTSKYGALVKHSRAVTEEAGLELHSREAAQM